jgi:hypothetical protein
MTLAEAVQGLIALEKLDLPPLDRLARQQEIVAELALEEVLHEEMQPV